MQAAWQIQAIGDDPLRVVVMKGTYEVLIATPEGKVYQAELRPTGEQTPAAGADLDPTTPEGYAQVMADEALQLKWQDRLDAFFQGRIVEVRNALRDLGWEGRSPEDARLYKGESEVQPTLTTVGAGANVVAYAMNGITDDLTKTPQQFAAEIDAAAIAETERRAGAATDQQALIDAYIHAFATKAEKINAAVAAIDWDGIKDVAGANAELVNLIGPYRGANDIKMAQAALENAGLTTWDERLRHIDDTDEFKALRAAEDAYRSAANRLQAIAKERLREAGNAELASLPPNAPIEEIAGAVYRKHGIDSEAMANQMIAAINAKNADYLRDVLGNLDNKASAELFERATGIKLAAAKKERLAQIDAWAGITPQQRADIESGKDAARAAQLLESSVRNTWEALKSMQVRGTDGDVQQLVLRQYAAGYTEVGAVQKGAATRYGMSNGVQLYYVQSRNFTAFLKAARDYGGLRKALELVGAELPSADADVQLTGKELGDFPDTEEGKKELRAAAKSMLDSLVGKWIACPALGGDVEVRKRGAKKLISKSADPRKLRLVAAIEKIIGVSRKLA